MNNIALLDLAAVFLFGAAAFVAGRLDKAVIDRPSKFFLLFFLGVYFFVAISNVLEHLQISDFFDRFEDDLEIMFLPFFMFFLFSMQTREEFSLRKATEANLRRSRELYRSLVENIDLGVTLLDRDHTILAVNSAQERLLGRRRESILGRKCFREFAKRYEICPHCPGGKAMKSEKPQEADIRSTVGGEERTLRIRAFPLFTEQGEPAGFIEVVEDITDRLRIEQELQKAQKLESVGILAGGIAHDFNNLLTGILGNISLARMYGTDKARADQKLEAAEKAITRAKGLSQQLLTFSRGGAPVKQVTSVNALIHEPLDFILQGTGVKGEYQIDDDVKYIDVDAGQLGQVLQNLAINACQAMPDGGVLRVSAGNATLRPGQVADLPAGEYVTITMQDQGRGIPPEQVNRIFDPYFTTKKKGSGLGLAVCYAIVKNHNGAITVDSSPGRGSTFTIHLPVSLKEKIERQASPGKIYHGTGRVLLMDDEEIILELGGDILARLGYEVETARSGEEAVQKYQQAAQCGRPFALVILDLTVPGGMGGREALARIHALDPAAKAVVSSGYANDPVLAEYRKHGFAGIIPKPYRLDEFSRVLHEVLNPSLS